MDFEPGNGLNGVGNAWELAGGSSGVMTKKIEAFFEPSVGPFRANPVPKSEPATQLNFPSSQFGPKLLKKRDVDVFCPVFALLQRKNIF